MNWMEHRANTQLETKLDTNDYDEASLIELKVPLDIPYQTDWKDFERYDGEITIDGQHYKYVKRKIQDGMLVLKCIPNESKHRIESARDQFFQLANDLQNNDSPKKSDAPKHSTAKSGIMECEEVLVFALAINPSANLKEQMSGNRNSTISRPHSSPEQPPEA